MPIDIQYCLPGYISHVNAYPFRKPRMPQYYVLSVAKQYPHRILWAPKTLFWSNALAAAEGAETTFVT